MPTIEELMKDPIVYAMFVLNNRRQLQHSHTWDEERKLAVDGLKTLLSDEVLKQINLR